MLSGSGWTSWDCFGHFRELQKLNLNIETTFLIIYGWKYWRAIAYVQHKLTIFYFNPPVETGSMHYNCSF